MTKIVIKAIKNTSLVTVSNGLSFYLYVIKNRKLHIRVEETYFLHFEGVLLIKMFGELEKNLTMNMVKPSHI